MAADTLQTGSQLLDAARSQLVIVDVQERLGAAMPSKVLNRVIKNTALLMRAAAILDIPTIITLQYPRGLGPLVGELEDRRVDTMHVVEKTSFSCAGDDGFLNRLEAGRDQICIAGMEAHVCVLQTAIDLTARGMTAFVAEDAICSRRLENYQNALTRMRQSAVTIGSAESAVFEWLRDASHPRFKALSALLR
jgi:nicotinamidase-related amidase